MDADTSPASHFAHIALEHVKVLAASPRGSATSAEKQAAEYTRAKLEALGVKDVKLQPFSGLRSLWLFLALAFGLALVGHAAYWLLRAPAGDLMALIIAVLAFGLSGWMLWRRFTFHDFPLQGSLPHAPSQNVIAVLPPQDEVHQQVVLVSHLDSHRAVFWFATDFLVKLFAVLSLLTIYGVYLAPVVYILAMITHLSFIAWLGAILLLLHFLAWFTGVTADLGRYSPGANDNASSVGSLLALAERLQAQPLEHTEVWLAFTGCEESGCDGMISLIREYGKTLKDAWFFDLEMVGIGDVLTYIRDEGNLRRHHIPADMEELLKEVGKPYGLLSVSTPPVGAFTEGGTLWEYGLKAACISAGKAGSPIAPEWHRLTDIPTHLEVKTLGRVQALVLELLQRLDQRGA